MFARLCNPFRRSKLDWRETRERRKYDELRSESNEGRRRWTWRMWRTRRQISSIEADLIENEFKEEEERMTKELHLITQKRNEQRDRLISFKEGSMNKRARPFQNLNPHYEQLILMKKQVISLLHNLEMEKIESHENSQELKKQINFYINLRSRLMMEMNHVKRFLTLQSEGEEVQIDWARIEKHLVYMNLNGKEDAEQTSNLETQQLQDLETPTRAEISTAQEESLLHNEFPPQDPPAELHLQHPQSPLDESSSLQFISSM